MNDWRPDLHIEGVPDDMPENERIALGLIMEHGRSIPDRTVERIAEDASRATGDIRLALENLRDDGWVESDVDAKLEIEFWRSTPKAAE